MAAGGAGDGGAAAALLPVVAAAWRGATEAVEAFCHHGAQPAAPDYAALMANLRCLAQHHLGETASAWCLRRLKDGFKSGVVPHFWDYFGAAPRPDGGATARRRCFAAFGAAVRTLADSFGAYLEVLGAVEAAVGQGGLRQTFQMDVRAYVHYSQQPAFADVARLFFEHTFLSFASLHDSSDTAEERLEDGEAPEAVAQAFASVCGALHCLELVERCASVCINMLYERVARRIDRLCEDNCGAPLLSEVLQWVEDVAGPWLAVFASSPGRAAEDHPLFQQWRTRLEYFVYHTYGNHRLAHFFDLVVDFPDSEPAVLDLQTCLAMTGQHPQLVHEATRQIRQRLLHAGAKTTDILRFLIQLIKAVNVLYGHGGILDRLSADIKAYLRQRKDTVRSIVLGLIDDSGTANDLADLLHRELKSSNEDNTLTVYYSSDEEEAVVQPSQGKPVPLRSAVENKAVDIAKVLGLSQKTDIIKTLVSIFGTKDVFVEEYRTILAAKLLACENYDTTREVVALELLKIRFGEAALQGCEVMVRDVAESKRIHANLAPLRQREVPVSDVQLDCTIVSKLFWPDCWGEEFTPHPRLAALQDQYGAHYRRLKAPRMLQYQPALGAVTMALQYPTATLTVTASPLHASILLHFEDQPRWAAADLAAALDLEAPALRRHLRFWTSKGVVEEPAEGQFVLVEDASTVAVDDTSYQAEEDDGPPQPGPPKEADWKSIEPFIINTLTNLQSLDLSGIYNYLRWLATDPPFRHTEAALREHLHAMIHDDVLILENGKYRLKSRRR